MSRFFDFGAVIVLVFVYIPFLFMGPLCFGCTTNRTAESSGDSEKSEPSGEFDASSELPTVVKTDAAYDLSITGDPAENTTPFDASVSDGDVSKGFFDANGLDGDTETGDANLPSCRATECTVPSRPPAFWSSLIPTACCTSDYEVVYDGELLPHCDDFLTKEGECGVVIPVAYQFDTDTENDCFYCEPLVYSPKDDACSDWSGGEDPPIEGCCLPHNTCGYLDDEWGCFEGYSRFYDPMAYPVLLCGEESGWSCGYDGDPCTDSGDCCWDERYESPLCIVRSELPDGAVSREDVSDGGIGECYIVEG